MDYAEICEFIDDVVNNVRIRPFTEEENKVLECVRFNFLPCARRENSPLALYILRHMVDFTAHPQNRFRVASVSTLRGRYKPYCGWSVYFKFTDPAENYTGGLVAKRAREILSVHPGNCFIRSHLRHTIYDEKDFWVIEFGMNSGEAPHLCSCNRVFDGVTTQPKGLVYEAEDQDENKVKMNYKKVFFMFLYKSMEI